MREFRIDLYTDRNIIITSYLVSSQYPLEERKTFYVSMFESKFFPEYQSLVGENDFFTPEYLVSHLQWPYPYEEINLKYKDVLSYYSRELSFRKKRFILTRMAGYDKDLEATTLDELQNDLQDIINSEKDMRIVDTSIDGASLYEGKKNSKLGLLTGIASLDEVCYGLGYGRLAVVYGYVGQGKTTLLLNLLYMAVSHGYNSAFISLEITKGDLYLQFLSIHSYKMASKFGKDPVEYQAILKGALSKEEEAYVFGDLENSLKELPGKVVFIEQDDVADFTYGGLQSFLTSLDFPVDALFLDYMQVLIPYVIGKTRNDYMAAAKVVSDFRRIAVGSTVYPQRIVVVGAQANRDGYERAVIKDGQYDLRAIAEIPQLEKEAYYAISVYTDDKLRQSGETKICLPKHRGGRIISEPVIIPVDHRYSVMGEAIQGYTDAVGTQEVESLLNSGFDLETMISGNTL